MTSAETNTEAPNWLAELLRLTAFLSPSVAVKEAGWWASTIGSEPESYTAKPSRGELVEIGSYLDNTLTLSVQPGRIDWLLTISQAQIEDVEIKLKTVGRFPSVAEDFAVPMNVWLSDCPPIIRLAF